MSLSEKLVDKYPSFLALQWNNSVMCSAVSQRAAGKTELVCPQHLTNLLRHLLVTFFFSLSYCSTLMLLEVALQISYLYPNPCLRSWFEGNTKLRSHKGKEIQYGRQFTLWNAGGVRIETYSTDLALKRYLVTLREKFEGGYGGRCRLYWRERKHFPNKSSTDHTSFPGN